jgi:hypothetical protein
MSTNLRSFPFDDSGNDIHVIVGKDDPTASSSDDYTATELQFMAGGVIITRSGVGDRVFVPYENIRRIYQTV